MLKCASIYTYEIDYPETALEELKAQLDKKLVLLKHTVGIIMCHNAFVESGASKHIAENLPFETVGVTTSSQAVDHEAGELILTVFVITAEDAWFRTGVTRPFETDIPATVKDAYDKASSGADWPLKLVIVFPPLIPDISGDDYVNAWKEAAGSVPIFGTFAVDDTLTFDECGTLCCGEYNKRALSFVLCYGNITPRFLVGTMPQERALPYKSEVTKSNGAYIQEINNINAYQYFESIKLASNGTLNVRATYFIPFVIDQKKREDYDGTPVIRGHAHFTEDGTAVFRGDIDEGSALTLLMVNSDDVLSTTTDVINQLNAMPGINGVLLFSCVVRRMMVMPINPLVELEYARDLIKPDIPFMMGYAGGEICPTSFKSTIPANRFHNFSIIILVL
jgi:hypothetical protein